MASQNAKAVMGRMARKGQNVSGRRQLDQSLANPGGRPDC
jgi:hypothetical protein